MKGPLLFKGSDNPGMLGQIEALRLYVWRRLIDTEVAYRRFAVDEFDNKAWHIAYLSEGRIIASGRVIIVAGKEDIPDLCSFAPYLEHMKLPIAVLNRLVVHPKHCRKGLGRQLYRDRIELASRKGVDDVWVEVQENRVGSMRRLGFKEVGPSQDKTIKGDWRIMRRSDRRESLNATG